MDDCLFCKIVKGEIPSSKVYEDDKVIAFRDIDPKAPVHVLIVPKKHCASIMEADAEITLALFEAAKKLAKMLHVDQNGFRLVINTGKDAGQSVPHLHIHLLGDRELAWPPG